LLDLRLVFVLLIVVLGFLNGFESFGVIPHSEKNIGFTDVTLDCGVLL
jgi:hypothetical protein